MYSGLTLHKPLNGKTGIEITQAEPIAQIWKDGKFQGHVSPTNNPGEGAFYPNESGVLVMSVDDLKTLIKFLEK